MQTVAIKAAEKWCTHSSSGELHYSELGEMRRGVGKKAAHSLLDSITSDSDEGVICEIDASAAFKEIKRGLSSSERNKMPEPEHMLPVLWVKLTCSKGNSQVGNWYLYFKQLIACKFLIT